MAAKKKQEQDSASEQTLPSVIGTAGLPAGLEAELPQNEEDLGYSTNTDDQLVPLLLILQDQSAEVKPRNSKHIEGAEAGMFIIRSLGRIMEGPLFFQPCAFQHVFTEWDGPAGEGNFVAVHDFHSPPSDMEEVADPEDEGRTIIKRANGNRLTEVRQHYGFLLTEEGSFPCVIPMGGTSHSVSRQWTSLMNQFKVGGRKVPGWFRAYRVTTAYNERGSQSWFKYRIDDAGWIEDAAQRKMGQELFEAVGTGTIRAASEEAAEAVGETESPI